VSRRPSQGQRLAAGKLTAEEIRARFRVVCICTGIKLGAISDAIRAGATTVQEVNRTTGSGSGDCGATRCRPVIEEMLRNGGRAPVGQSSPEPTEKGDDFWFPTPVRKTKPD
jgi:bacterioferritin-associated ferredoxin